MSSYVTSCRSLGHLNSSTHDGHLPDRLASASSSVSRSACASKMCRRASAITFSSPGYLHNRSTNLAAFARARLSRFSSGPLAGRNRSAGTSAP